jgi:replicative DNA helicase
MEKFQKDISFEDYALWVQVNLGKDYDPFLSLIKESNTDETILGASLNEIKTRSILYELASAALAGSEGKKTVEQVLEIVDQLAQEETNNESSPFISTSLSELYDDTFKHKGLRWRLASLNTSLGSLRKGDFGFIFARPESGKTTFLASEVSFFGQQVTSPILWFNNEEQHRKVMLRIIQASLGITLQELSKDIKRYEQQYREQTNDSIQIPNMDIIHKREVEAICKEVQPSLIIFDQLSKIKGFTNDRDDLRLGSTFEWARDLAKQYAPVIGVNQADGSGEGKKFLDMNNVAGAKTAIQAEADWILGIGKSNDAGFELIRHFNISKNKLTGDEDTNPAMRHSKFDCLIQPDIARYRDL